MPSLNSSGTGSSKSSNGRTAAVPTCIEPYIFHGVHLGEPKTGASQIIGDCPFCGSEGKFFIGLRDVDQKHFAGGWHCKTCDAGGNLFTFLNNLWQTARDNPAPDVEYTSLASERGLLHISTLKDWGVVKSPLTSEWLVPAYNAEGGMIQLYRYVNTRRKDGSWRRVLMASKEIEGRDDIKGVGMFNVPSALRNPKASELLICEGPWDGMVLEELMSRAKHRSESDSSLAVTASRQMSLLGNRIVVAVPGANAWQPTWCRLGVNRIVTLLYDNDWPRKAPNGGTTEGAAIIGMKKVAGEFARASEPPTEMRYVAWGGAGHQHNPAAPSGYDVRDLLTSEATLLERFELLQTLLEPNLLIHPIPQEWIKGGGEEGSVVIEPLECDSWRTLDDAWRRAAKWTPGLRGALVNMLCVATGVPVVGEQLWMKIVGPPSSFKTTLAEAISVARRYVIPKDTFTGLTSGYQVDREGSENLSLVIKIKDKTLVIKDADTIIQHPNKSQILSQFRGLYDRAFRTSYNNKMSVDHDNVSTGVILCGTSSLRVLDDSELGQRFLDWEIMASVDPELEKEINTRSLNHFREQMAKSPLTNGEGADSPERIKAKRLTGGYIQHLRSTCGARLRELEVSDEALEACDRCGLFAAFFRSRPSGKQTEEVHRELSTRLVLQFAKLGYCAAVVLGRKSIDHDVLDHLRKVALDTARGTTLNLARFLYISPDEGVLASQAARYLGETDDKTKGWLRFLRRIHVVEQFEWTSSALKQWRWRLTPSVQRLYATVADPTGELAARYAPDREDSDRENSSRGDDSDNAESP